MAKVDEEFFDWHEIPALVADDVGETDPRPTTLQTELKARRSGRLYLYLNDAVVFLPGLFGSFYDNNNGCAEVTVVELQAEGTPEAEKPAGVQCSRDE